MFGYASRETDNFMPLPLEIAHTLLRELSAIRREGKEMKYLRPDAKSQVTVQYEDDNTPIGIDKFFSFMTIQAGASYESKDSHITFNILR